MLIQDVGKPGCSHPQCISGRLPLECSKGPPPPNTGAALHILEPAELHRLAFKPLSDKTHPKGPRENFRRAARASSAPGAATEYLKAQLGLPSGRAFRPPFSHSRSTNFAPTPSPHPSPHLRYTRLVLVSRLFHAIMWAAKAEASA